MHRIIVATHKAASTGENRYLIECLSEASEMFQIRVYEDKPNAFGLPIHSFISYVSCL